MDTQEIIDELEKISDEVYDGNEDKVWHMIEMLKLRVAGASDEFLKLKEFFNNEAFGKWDIKQEGSKFSITGKYMAVMFDLYDCINYDVKITVNSLDYQEIHKALVEEQINFNSDARLTLKFMEVWDIKDKSKFLKDCSDEQIKKKLRENLIYAKLSFADTIINFEEEFLTKRG